GDLCVTVRPAYYRERENRVVAEALHSGRVSGGFDKSLHTGREPLSGALCVTARLAPGASKRISFLLTLDFPEIRFPGLESRKKYTAFFPEKEKRAVDMALEAWRGRHHARSVADALHAGLENAPGLERL